MGQVSQGKVAGLPERSEAWAVPRVPAQQRGRGLKEGAWEGWDPGGQSHLTDSAPVL